MYIGLVIVWSLLKTEYALERGIEIIICLHVFFAEAMKSAGLAT